MNRVLVVDDHAASRLIYKTVLNRLNVEVHFAESGKRAVEIFQSQQYHLILMDVLLPEMDGITATIRIRELESGAAAVPIVAVTAMAMNGDRERCLAAGMDDYLAKPFTVEEFRAMALKWLGRKQDSAAQGGLSPKVVAD